MNYHNEFDPKAAAWLKQLISNKQIPNGHVDPRSILEVQPSDLSDFVQCHFFAGIGGWSEALRLAGWPEDRPVWTASLPCQPFSSAGKQKGTGDERHLWPVFRELVAVCRPPVIFGEQVASKLARDDWFPGVRMDLEALGYEVGAADLCAPCAGEIGEGRIVRGGQEAWERTIIGAPHIRQRLYWGAARMADADSERRSGFDALLRQEERGRNTGCIPEATRCREADGMANTRGSDELRDAGSSGEGVDEARQPDGRRVLEADGGVPPCRMDHPERTGPQGQHRDGDDRDKPGRVGAEPGGSATPAGGPYSSFDLLACRDGKIRRIESGLFPLVDGIPRGVVPSGDPSSPEYANATAEARAMRLKGYGNAIVPPLAALFIKSFVEATHS